MNVRIPAFQATDGAAYEAFIGGRTRSLASAVLDVAAFGDEGTLLDVGCGTGNLACAMAARWPGRRVVGVDPSEPFIAVARSRETSPSLTFDVGDATRLSYEDGAFAGVASQLTLNFIPDAGAAAKEMRRVTRSGGIVVAAVFDFRGGTTFQRLFWDTAAGLDPQAIAWRARLFSAVPSRAGGLQSLFIAAGLDRVEESLITIRMSYESFDDFWRPMLGGQGTIGSYVAQLSDAMRSRVEAAVREAYCAGLPDGPCAMSASAWAARGIAP